MCSAAKLSSNFLLLYVYYKCKKTTFAYVTNLLSLLFKLLSVQLLLLLFLALCSKLKTLKSAFLFYS